jgi:hypothetical protein
MKEIACRGGVNNSYGEGFNVDDDNIIDKNPDYMVFPDLAGLPEVDPCHVCVGMVGTHSKSEIWIFC